MDISVPKPHTVYTAEVFEANIYHYEKLSDDHMVNLKPIVSRGNANASPNTRLAVF